MKARIKYYFSRLIILLVALHTLDISVDLDYLTNTTGWYNVEKHDDIDSISEFLIEGICNNDDLFTESNHDDSHQSKHHLHKFSVTVLYVNGIKDWNVNPTFQDKNSFRQALRNSTFLPEDHSSSDYNPPDLS